MKQVMGATIEHDPRVVESWWSGARDSVLAHLADEGVRHGAVAERPAWCVTPYVAVWAVAGAGRSGRIGWWVVSGDLPADHVHAGSIENAREALAAVAAKWIGTGDDPSPLARLRERRAETLLAWACDDDLWDDPPHTH